MILVLGRLAVLAEVILPVSTKDNGLLNSLGVLVAVVLLLTALEG